MTEQIEIIQNRTWFPIGTEVRTTEGWVPIHLFTKIEKLIGYNFNSKEFTEVSLKEYNKYSNYDNKIQKRQGIDFYYEGLILLPDNKMIRADHSYTPLSTVINLDYSGDLFNIVTSNNTLITRQTNNDYIITICKIAE